MKKMIQVAYFAGIIDGESTLVVSGAGRQYPQLRHSMNERGV